MTIYADCGGLDQHLVVTAVRFVHLLDAKFTVFNDSSVHSCSLVATRAVVAANHGATAVALARNAVMISSLSSNSSARITSVRCSTAYLKVPTMKPRQKMHGSTTAFGFHTRGMQ